MFSIEDTLLLYNSILFVCYFLSIIGEKSKRKDFLYLAYIILFLFIVFRYDIGHDYENYARSITAKAQLFQSGYTFNQVFLIDYSEPTFLFLIYIFSSFQDVIAYVVSVYGFFYVFFLYKVFNRYSIHSMGIVVLIVTTILFQSLDWMRQGVSMALFLYSLKFLEEGRFAKYLTCILFSALWHFSCMILLLAYPLRKWNVKNSVLAVILLSVFITAEIGLFKDLATKMMILMPFYGENFAGGEYASFSEFKYWTLPFIFQSLWYIVLVWNSKEQQHLSKLLFIGVFFFIVSGKFLLVERVAWFFLCVSLIIVPSILKKKSLFVRLIIIPMLIFNYLYLNRQILNGGVRGCTPYETVFSDEYQSKTYRTRPYQ